MAVRIRLKRMGAKKRPHYRLVVADSRSARDGRIIETLGHYDPLAEPSAVTVDGEKARAWIQQGAQPSDTARRLLVQAGVIEGRNGTSSAEGDSQRDVEEEPVVEEEPGGTDGEPA